MCWYIARSRREVLKNQMMANAGRVFYESKRLAVGEEERVEPLQTAMRNFEWSLALLPSTIPEERYIKRCAKKHVTNRVQGILRMCIAHREREYDVERDDVQLRADLAKAIADMKMIIALN